MPQRVTARRALLALVAAVALAPAAASAATGPAAMPTIYVKYTMNCTFSLLDDFGRPVTAIAPGTYQVQVSTPIMFKLVVPGGPTVDPIAPDDFSGCKGWVQFQLTGPGVSLFTTLDTGCESVLTLPPTTFPPGSTFTAQDLNQPSVTRTTFTTLTSGTPAAPPSPYSASTGKGTPSTDIVGSEIDAPLRGTLAASLSAAGTPALELAGKRVSRLAPGRYTFRLADADPRAGLTLQGAGGKPRPLTAGPFVGKRTVTVRLTSGRWTVSGRGGRTLSFIVR